MKSSLLSVSLVSFVSSSLAATTPNSRSYSDAANALCRQLQSKIPSRVAYNSIWNTTSYGPLTNAYDEAVNRYNNIANRDDVPACVLFPSSATDVSIAMKLLSASPTVPFALKSGGHDWNRGFSSTDGGLLISFRPYLNYTTLSKDKASAQIGPGARWAEVLATLDPYDRVAVGGRNGDVGVGGYIPKGGISFLTAEYGFGSDNVLSFEVVLSNGTIVTASRTNPHSDLFWALRGGGGPLFGAITKLTLAAHPTPPLIWSKTITYSYSQISAALLAVSDFTANFSDVRAAVLPTLIRLGPAIGNTIQLEVQLFYDGANPPKSLFAGFEGLPSVNTTKGSPNMRYKDAIGGGGALAAARSAGAVSSIPNLPRDKMREVFEWIVTKAENASFAVTPDVGLEFFTMAFQSIPVLLQETNFRKGPGALATDPKAGDKIWVEYTLGWTDPGCDVTCARALRGLVDHVEVEMQDRYTGVKATNWKGGCEEDKYSPLFFNDAMWDQNVYRSYGNESYWKLRGVRETYDPKGMLLTQTSQIAL